MRPWTSRCSGNSSLVFTLATAVLLWGAVDALRFESTALACSGTVARPCLDAREVSLEARFGLAGLSHHGIQRHHPVHPLPKRAPKPIPEVDPGRKPGPDRLPLAAIRFMQCSVKNETGPDFTVVANGRALREHTLRVEAFPPAQVWQDRHGRIWALDHRRLVSFHLSGVVDTIPVEWVGREAVLKDSFKMTTADLGETIVVTLEPGAYLLVSRTGRVPVSSRRLYSDGPVGPSL